MSKYTTMVFVGCMGRCRVGSGRTVRTFVMVCHEFEASLYWCSIQYEVVMSPSCDVQITTMTMAAVRLFWLHVCNGVVLTLDEQRVGLHWCMLVFEASCCCCSIQYVVVIMSPSCFVQKRYNGNNGCALIFVEFMEQCRVGHGRTVGTFEFEASCYWFSIPYEVVMSPSYAVQIYYNGDDGCTVIFDGWYGTVSCWPWTNSKCVCIGVCLNLKQVVIGVRCSMRS